MHEINSNICQLSNISDVFKTINYWATQQFSPWRKRTISRSELQSHLTELSNRNHNVFVFTIDRGNVDLADKSTLFHDEYFEHSLLRAKMYRLFLETTVRCLCPDLCTTLAIFVGDGSLDHIEMPIFSFQKILGNKSPLLPDVGLIDPRFFMAQNYLDHIKYEEKEISAIFAGSTTGGLITPEAIRNGSIPRVRAAMFFSGHENVHFHLPNILNHDSDEALNMLRDLGFGRGEHIDWPEQFRHLFLLSMDGNGPSPARIAIGLKSNCILMHYVTEHNLYYFAGLQPWVHYLPIYQDEDVLQLIEHERKNPGFYRFVALEGKNFAENYLTPFGVMYYTCQLLRSYERLFDDAVEKGGKTSRLAHWIGLEELSLLSSRVFQLEMVAAQEKDRGDTLAAMFWKERERAEAAYPQEKLKAERTATALDEERQQTAAEISGLRDRVDLLEAVLRNIEIEKQLDSPFQKCLQHLRWAATFQFMSNRRSKQRMRKVMEATLQSGLFDREWYLWANPDVAAKGVDPLKHYCSSGYLERRRPGPNADDAWISRLLEAFPPENSPA